MVRSIEGARAPLSRPWVRRALCRDLALSNVTQSDLAEKYGVTGGAITQFKQRNAQEIEAIRADSADEYAGLLLAQKQARIATYSEMIEDAHARGDAKTAGRLLRQIAEELGALPQRVAISGQLDTQSRYVIDGVDMEALR